MVACSPPWWQEQYTYKLHTHSRQTALSWRWEEWWLEEENRETSTVTTEPILLELNKSLRSALMEWTRPRFQTLCHETESSGSSTLLQLLISGESGRDLFNQQRRFWRSPWMANWWMMAEIESLLNSRPLTHVSIDPQDPEAITPNHFLTGRNSPNVPPDVFDERDLNSRKRWRQAQTLFWRRWLREYMSRLTERRKWTTRSQTDAQIGDLVLVVEDNLPRGRWNLGRVVKTFPGDDGLIRTVEVQTTQGTFKRPVAKLCLLEEAERSV